MSPSRPEPERGWKIGFLGWEKDQEGRLRFRPVSQHSIMYDAYSQFRCGCGGGEEGRGKHAFPTRNTSCGFYAMRTRDQVTPNGLLHPGNDSAQDLWLLEVELYGHVVKCRNGYRAEKQRVMSARPFYKPADNMTPALDLVATPDRPREKEPWYPKYLEIRQAISDGGLVLWSSIDGLFSRGSVFYGLPAYGHCLHKCSVITRSELAGRLGTEILPYDGTDAR